MRAFVLNEYKSKKGTKKQISWAVFFQARKGKDQNPGIYPSPWYWRLVLYVDTSNMSPLKYI